MGHGLCVDNTPQGRYRPSLATCTGSAELLPGGLVANSTVQQFPDHVHMTGVPGGLLDDVREHPSGRDRPVAPERHLTVELGTGENLPAHRTLPP